MPDTAATRGGMRPIERVVTRLHRDGHSLADIGKKVRKKPGTVERILEMAELRKDALSSPTPNDHPLRPVERVVVKLRANGESYGEIGNRLARSGRQVQLIERLAEFKLSS